MDEPDWLERRVPGTVHEVADQLIGALRLEGFGIITRLLFAHESQPVIVIRSCYPRSACASYLADPARADALKCDVIIREAGSGTSRIGFERTAIESALARALERIGPQQEPPQRAA